MKKIKNSILKITISSVVLIGLVVLIWGTVYHFENNMSYLSNSLFAVGAIAFVISLGISISSGMIFNPFTYTARLMFARRKLKEEFSSYHEYLEYKRERNKTNAWFLVIESGILLVVAFIFGMIAIN